MVAPYDAEDARGLLKAAIRDPDPVVFLENEILYGEAFPITEKVLDPEFTVPIGKAKVRVTVPPTCLHCTCRCAAGGVPLAYSLPLVKLSGPGKVVSTYSLLLAEAFYCSFLAHSNKPSLCESGGVRLAVQRLIRGRVF